MGGANVSHTSHRHVGPSAESRQHKRVPLFNYNRRWDPSSTLKLNRMIKHGVRRLIKKYTLMT